MFFFLFENSNNNVTIISSIAQKIINTLFSFVKVFIIVDIFTLNKLSKFLLKIKCKLTEKYAFMPMLKNIATIVKIFLLIFFLLYRNSAFLLYYKIKEHLLNCKCSNFFANCMFNIIQYIVLKYFLLYHFHQKLPKVYNYKNCQRK